MPHMKQLSHSYQQFSLIPRRIRGDRISMFNTTHGPLGFPKETTFTNPTRTGLNGNAHKFHQNRCLTRRPQYALNIRTVTFWN